MIPTLTIDEALIASENLTNSLFRKYDVFKVTSGVVGCPICGCRWRFQRDGSWLVGSCSCCGYLISAVTPKCMRGK